jgi:hypothetical protein
MLHFFYNYFLKTGLFIICLSVYFNNSFAQITAMQMGMYDFKVLQSLSSGEMNGTTDVTIKLQNAVNAARDTKRTLFIPSGTYKISGQILCLETHDPNVTSNNAPNLAVNIVGSTINHPTIVLADNTPVFKGANPVAVFHYMPDQSLKNPYNNNLPYDPGWVMEGGIRGINIDLGTGNTKAVGIFWSCAQYCYIEDININAREGFAGLTGIGGANCLTANISVNGGRYGFYLPNSSEESSWIMAAANQNTITGCSFINQSIAALNLNGWGGITIVGSSIIQSSGTAIIMNGSTYVEAFPLSIIDCSIQFTNQSTSNIAISNSGQNLVSLRGLYVQGAGKICNNNSDGDVPNSGTIANWTHIIRYNYVYKNSKANSLGTNMQGMHFDAITGTQSNIDINNAEVVTTIPSDLISKHIWATTPSFEDADAVLITATDATGIQNAINVNPKVCFPKGTFSLTSPITLNANTILIGCPGRGTCGTIFSYGFTPTMATWLINTVNNATATTYLFDITTNAGNADYLGSVNWQAGKNSIIRNLWCDKQWINNEHNLIRLYFTNNGGGRVFNYQDEKGTTPSNSSHRKVAISGTSQPLFFYGLNLERGGSAYPQSSFPMLDISNASNIFIFGGKTETSQPYANINNSKNIFITNTTNLTNFGPFNINYILVTGTSDSLDISNSIFYKSPSASYYVVADQWNNISLPPRTIALGCYHRNWSSISNVSSVVTAINAPIMQNKIFQVYPNPADNYLIISTASFIQSNDHLKIFDTSGKLVNEIRLSSQEQVINVGELSGGLYIAKYKNSSLKFIKK